MIEYVYVVDQTYAVPSLHKTAHGAHLEVQRLLNGKSVYQVSSHGCDGTSASWWIMYFWKSDSGHPMTTTVSRSMVNP